MFLLDWLFPKRCVVCKRIDDYFCCDCFARMSFDVNLLCVQCNQNVRDGLTHQRCKTDVSIDGVFASVVYSRVMKKALYSFKYAPFVSDLKTSLGELFYEGIIQREGFIKALDDSCVLMPIPLHPQKLRTRGYNHAGLLAQDLSRRLGVPFCDLLTRVKITKPQFGLSKNERSENMAGAFTLNKPIPAETVFLVDDVLTSGSTMKEAAKMLKKSGVKHVWGIVLARDQNM